MEEVFLLLADSGVRTGHIGVKKKKVRGAYDREPCLCGPPLESQWRPGRKGEKKKGTHFIMESRRKAEGPRDISKLSLKGGEREKRGSQSASVKEESRKALGIILQDKKRRLPRGKKKREGMLGTSHSRKMGARGKGSSSILGKRPATTKKKKKKKGGKNCPDEKGNPALFLPEKFSHSPESSGKKKTVPVWRTTRWKEVITGYPTEGKERRTELWPGAGKKRVGSSSLFAPMRTTY